MAAQATSPELRKNYHGMRVTREIYLDLPDDGNKYDMIDGVLYMAPSANSEHGKKSVDFAFYLRRFLETHKVGQAISEVDIFLPDGGDVLRPDVSFVLNENTYIIETHIHGTPDLVCEILSESTRKRDLGVKADRYLKNGVKEYFIIDPDEKSIQLWINRGENWEKISADELNSELLKGFSLKRKDFFASQ